MYTRYMNFFVKATVAPKPKSSNIRKLGIGLSTLYAMMAITQLFSMPAFIDVIYQMNMPSITVAAVVAGLLIASEIAAIPFLLGLKLSPLMRLASLKAGYLVIIAWLVLSIIDIVSGATQTLGLFGGDVLIVPGWWAVWYLLGLMIVQIWVSWGWWPKELTKLKKKRK